MPDITESSLKDTCAFNNIGIDYAGPLFIYVYNKSNELFKAWIALIVCPSTRAVYLDLATNYSGETCIKVLKKFFNRLGVPEINISDNGTSFIAADVQNYALL